MEEELSLATERSDSISEKEKKRALFHPFKCRLDDTASIEISSATCMTQVGFAWWSIGMLTLFRPCFVLLIAMLKRLNITTSKLKFQVPLLAICYFWFAVIVFVLFVLGFIPMLATFIKKRWVLLIHPWALLVLYVDFIIWLTITIFLHIEIFAIDSEGGEQTVKQVENVELFFGVIYLDILAYFIIHYVYGTYYIVAELTIIEKFY